MRKERAQRAAISHPNRPRDGGYEQRAPHYMPLLSQDAIALQVNAIDVDVETGQLHVSPQLVAEINTRAKGLALSVASALED